MKIIKTDQVMKKKQFVNHFHYISLIDHLCKHNAQSKEYSCRVRLSNTNELMQIDYGHLSKEGSLFIVNNIIADKILYLYKDT